MPPFGPNLEPARGTAAADWIRPRLGVFGTVGGVVPGGFDAYLMIGPDPGGASSGRQQMELLGKVVAIAAQNTTTPLTAWFAVWTGYGWTHSMTLVSTQASWWGRRRLRRQDEARTAALEEELTPVCRFDLPHREYFLLTGPVGAASGIDRPDGHGQLAPDLWWPDDHAWFVGSDVDLSWTYLGGSHSLAQDLASALDGQIRSVDWSASNAEVGVFQDRPQLGP